MTGLTELLVGPPLCFYDRRLRRVLCPAQPGLTLWPVDSQRVTCETCLSLLAERPAALIALCPPNDEAARYAPAAMVEPSVTKFYVRHRTFGPPHDALRVIARRMGLTDDDLYQFLMLPETEMQDAAFRGFYELGVNVAPFQGFGDLDALTDLSPTVGVAGYIGDVWRGLQHLGRPVPDPVDYPECLHRWLGRELRQTTLGAVRQMTQHVFVKPVEHKRFTGFVWRGAHHGESRMRVVTMPEASSVWVSDVVDFRAEYRVFILDGEILDVRRYRGDWDVAPERHVVEQMVRTWCSNGAPRACCLDVGVTADRTLLVEGNDGFAFGHYGMSSVNYARMLAARWQQLAGGTP